MQLAIPAGLEPATRGLEIRYSNFVQDSATPAAEPRVGFYVRQMFWSDQYRPWLGNRAGRGLHRLDQPRQVHGANRGLPRRDNVPSQPCEWHCRDGPLRASWPAADPVIGVTARPTAEWIAKSAH